MAVGVTIIKSMFRHGVAGEEWSNHYHLTGTDPANSTAWRTLFDLLVAQEKTLYSSACSVVRGYGYDDDDPTAHAVWSVDLTASPNTPVPGTLSVASSRQMPSDAAAWVRWKLDRLNSKGKPVYLRKYFHDQWGPTSSTDTTKDNVLAGWKTNALAFGNTLRVTGLSDGTKIRDTAGAALLGHSCSDYFTTRTLKRRGRRPTP